MNENSESSTQPTQQAVEGITARTEVKINAPIEVVWRAMLDLEAYSEWNPFIAKIDEIKGGAEVGGQFRQHVRWADGSEVTSWERVVSKVPPMDDGSGKKTATWSYQSEGLTSHVVWGVRTQNLEELPDNGTSYSTEERLHGVLSWAAGPLKDVQDGFERQAKALKERAEFLYELERTQFPANVPISRQSFENWSREIQVPNVLTCVPRTPEDIVDIVNWGAKNGYKVRPRGMMHNWSQLTLSPTEDTSKVLLVDMTQHLTKVVEPVKRNEDGSGVITVQAGITAEKFLTELQKEGLGYVATPGPGDLTVGGMITVAAHGTGLPPVSGEPSAKGHTYGSISNSVLSL
ncbi:MAG TPA: FAD-binding protein, partial [Burkholderiales bacterium]|nr:FAD-binding protein [Burkholderiales bacterium]